MNQFYKNKRVFVTGHLGFKGSWLCKILTLWGAEVYGYGLVAECQGISGMLGVEGQMTSQIADVRDLEALTAAMLQFAPDIVFHLAAQPLVLESYRNPVSTYSTNVMGTVHVLEAVKVCRSVQSVVNVTTDKVYGNGRKGFSEECYLDGFEPYSNSKSCSELVTACYRRSFFGEREIAVSTVRAGNVIGGGDFSKHRIIPDCVRAVMAEKPILIRNPYSIRPYQHVLEALFVYLLIAQRQYSEKTLAGAYNVGPDEDDCYTVEQLVTSFCALWGESAAWEVKVEKDAPYEAKFLMLQCDKLKRVFEWQPVWNMETALRYTVEWYRRMEAPDSLPHLTEEQITLFAAHFKVMLKNKHLNIYD